MTTAKRRPLTIDEVHERRDQLLVDLRAGISTDDPAYAWTHGERLPERDCYSLPTNWTDDTRTAIRPVAYHWPFDLEQRFRATYGKHDPTSWWAYEVPPGVEVATDEPEGWEGWRLIPPGQLELLAPGA